MLLCVGTPHLITTLEPLCMSLLVFIVSIGVVLDIW
jgi:hypothetical protein